MRVLALVRRIIRQFLRDKRTLAMMFLAPLLILWLVSQIFNGATYHPKIAVSGLPAALTDALHRQNVKVYTYASAADADKAVSAEQVDASVTMVYGVPHVLLEGSDPSKSKLVLLALQQALQSMQFAKSAVQPAGSSGSTAQTAPIAQSAPAAAAAHAFVPVQAPVVRYLYGSADMTGFDNFGPVLIGVFAFFFVLVIAGIAFLRERSSGTLERILTTPMRRWEVVAGYILGFGLFTTVQACLITWFSVKVLGMMMEGTWFNLLLTAFLLSLTALTLGAFLSAYANTEFQMIQFIPIVVAPQVFFSGLFSIDTMAPWLRWLSHIMPLYYGADALRNIMIRGKGLSGIYPDLLVLLGLSVCFIAANVIALKKYRRI